MGYTPKKIAIKNRDNDQQNHWVFLGTLFSDKPTSCQFFVAKNSGLIIRLSWLYPKYLDDYQWLSGLYHIIPNIINLSWGWSDYIGYIYIIDYIQDIRLYPGNNQYIRTLSESIRTGNPRFLISLLDSRWIEAIWLITSMPGKSTMARSMASWMCLDLLKVSSVAV